MYNSIKASKSVAIVSRIGVYQALSKTARLTQIIRQDSNNKQTLKFKLGFSELRIYNLSLESHTLLALQVQSELNRKEVEQFNNTLRLYFRHADIVVYNQRRLRDSGALVLRIKSLYTGKGAYQADKDNTKGILAELYLSIRARVILTQNLQTDNRLVNKSIGVVNNIVQRYSRSVKEIPDIILVYIDGYNSPTFKNTRCIPVFPVTRQFIYRATYYSRTNFLLVLAYAIIVYKSQGLTLPRAVLSLRYPDYSPGLSYMAFSRVKKLTNIIIKEPFSRERFGIKTTIANIVYRKLNQERRTSCYI